MYWSIYSLTKYFTNNILLVKLKNWQWFVLTFNINYTCIFKLLLVGLLMYFCYRCIQVSSISVPIKEDTSPLWETWCPCKKYWKKGIMNMIFLYRTGMVGSPLSKGRTLWLWMQRQDYDVIQMSKNELMNLLVRNWRFSWKTCRIILFWSAWPLLLLVATS